MPQLVKGGKWVFGWVVVGSGLEVLIPPEAYAEYGFQTGEPVVFLRGSRSSGGCALAREVRLSGSRIPLEQRALARGQMGEEGRIVFPTGTGVRPGERLLVGRGSGLGLGFLQRGPIYEEALKHPELETFTT